MKRLGIVAVGFALVVGIVVGGIVDNPFPASANGACTDGVANAIWTAGNGHCYMRFDSPTTCCEAGRDCENRGGYLATLTSADENAFVWANVGVIQTWFGFTDAIIEGLWQWITGEVAAVGQDTVYTNWGPGEPSDTPGGEDGGTYRVSAEGAALRRPLTTSAPSASAAPPASALHAPVAPGSWPQPGYSDAASTS